MAKKKVDEVAQEIRKAAESGKAVFGERETVKLLKQGKLSKIYLSQNCKKTSKEDVEQYGKLAQVEIMQTAYRNDELGILCRKYYAVSMLGVKNA